MSQHVKYPEETKEDTMDRVCKLFDCGVPETSEREGPKQNDKRKTKNIGW